MEIKWEIASSNTNVILPHKQISRVEGLGKAAISPTATPPPFVPHHPLALQPPPHPRVTTLPANKSSPARVTFGMFILREVQMCSAKNANGLLLCFVGRHRRFSVFVERQNGKSCKTFCLCTGSGGLNVSSLMGCRVSVATQRVTQVKKTACEQSSGLHTNKHAHRTVTCIVLNVEDV